MSSINGSFTAKPFILLIDNLLIYLLVSFRLHPDLVHDV